jgi:hypothetical protein
MSDQQSAKLIEAVQVLAEKVRRFQEQYRDRRLGEENTKAALIAPLLEALGWNIRDPEEVNHEYRQTPKDNPVDYCLRLERSPRLLVEAKGLGEDLTDRKWVLQTLGYATMTGAEWCVLTDGDQYLLYNATAPVEADLKLFCQVRLSDGQDQGAAKVLSLISRSNMSGPVLKELWQRYHADRRVKGAMRELVDTLDRKLVLLIRRRIPDLSPREIGEAIRRLNIRIDPHEESYQLGKGPPPLPRLPRNKPKMAIGQVAKRYGLRKRFWEGLLSRPSIASTRHAKLSAAEDGWIAASSGVRGLPFVYVIGQDEARVELYMDRGSGKAETNKRIFDWFEERKEEIERAFGDRLSWQRLEGKQGCRVAYTMTGGGWKSDEAKWPAIQDAMIDAMIRLENALTAHLEKLKAELAL